MISSIQEVKNVLVSEVHLGHDDILRWVQDAVPHISNLVHRDVDHDKEHVFQ